MNSAGYKTIEIPNSVTSIGNGAFFNASPSWQNINIPDSVTEIPEHLFAGPSPFKTNVSVLHGLLTVTIGSGVKSIQNEAFFNCTNLTTITIKATTPPSLGNKVFKGSSWSCPLTAIYVPADSVEAYKTADG